MKKDLKKYDIDCQNEKFKKVFEKRYKKNGEEYLKQVDKIDIKEDLKEKLLEINRIKEIFNNQERLKINDLIEDYSDENGINELKSYENYNEMDTYEFLNKTAEIQSLYNNMPEEIRKKYKNLAKFTKEYIPEFLEKTKKRFNEKKHEKEIMLKSEKINNTKAEIENQIAELQNKLKENTINE